jgi:hypothetical protein
MSPLSDFSKHVLSHDATTANAEKCMAGNSLEDALPPTGRVASLDHTVDPDAELPLVDGPAEVQVHRVIAPAFFATPAWWPVPSTERASYLGVLGRVWQDGVKAADCTALVLQVLELRTFTPEQQQRFFYEARLALNVTDVGNEAVTFASHYAKHWPTGRNLGW